MKRKDIDTINWRQEFPKVPTLVHSAIKSSTDMIMEREEREKRHWSKKGIVLLAASLTLFSGMTVFAANSLWQQRMEALNEQEMVEYFENIKLSNAPAFRYNRGLTESESENLVALGERYELEGLFPDGALMMLSEGEKYSGKGIAFEIANGTFCLPKEELNEEELLQIVDFYHKAEYSVKQISMSIQNGDIVLQDKKEDNIPEFMQQKLPVNENISSLEVALKEVDLPKEIGANDSYVYLGYDKEIKRMKLGTDSLENFFALSEEETLYAMDVQENGDMLLSLRCVADHTDSYENKIIKVNSQGEIVTEYDVESAIDKDGHMLQNLMAYKLQEDNNGNLYVKTRWSSSLLLYVFDKDGNYQTTIADSQYTVHPAGEMCFDKEGRLVVLGMNEIITIDTKEKQVINQQKYVTLDMTAAVELIYPMDDGSYYLFSYDGLYQTNLEHETCDKLLTPTESKIFEEGARCYPISEDTFVVANYKSWGITVTYVTITNN